MLDHQSEGPTKAADGEREKSYTHKHTHTHKDEKEQPHLLSISNQIEILLQTMDASVRLRQNRVGGINKKTRLRI